MKYTLKQTFNYEDKEYTEINLDFSKLTGRDLISIDEQLQATGKGVLFAESSRAFQCKVASRASGIGDDVMQALPFKDFNIITNMVRNFLIGLGE